MNVQRATEVLLCSWVLASDPDERLPIGQGVLDLGLKDAVERGAFPDDFKLIRFDQTVVSYRWVTIPTIVDHALSSRMLRSANPFYDAAIVSLSKETALMILDELGIDEERARSWGQSLKESIARVRG